MKLNTETRRAHKLDIYVLLLPNYFNEKKNYDYDKWVSVEITFIILIIIHCIDVHCERFLLPNAITYTYIYLTVTQ